MSSLVCVSNCGGSVLTRGGDRLLFLIIGTDDLSLLSCQNGRVVCFDSRARDRRPHTSGPPPCCGHAPAMAPKGADVQIRPFAQGSQPAAVNVRALVRKWLTIIWHWWEKTGNASIVCSFLLKMHKIGPRLT